MLTMLSLFSPKSGAGSIMVRSLIWVQLSELFDAPTDLIRVIFPNISAESEMQMFTSFCGLCGGVQGLESLES